METEKNKQAEPQEKSVRTYRCNDCGGVIYRHEVFCSNCGKKLDNYDFEDE
ncbi:MAG: hypothetical protein KBT29_05095 [Prevotellaceae bacterium]|nr:hypothetical protein [Candidatus Minthosoma caballi]